jgi:hypothetical protein
VNEAISGYRNEQSMTYISLVMQNSRCAQSIMIAVIKVGKEAKIDLSAIKTIKQIQHEKTT